MPQSKQGGSGRDNGATSKRVTDQQRSASSEKGKKGKTNHGAQGQPGKEDMGKGKSGNQMKK